MAVKDGLQRAVGVLSTLHGLFANNEPASQVEVHRAAQSVLERNPHIRSITFRRPASDIEGERPAFEAGGQKKTPDFPINEFDLEKRVDTADIENRPPGIGFLRRMKKNKTAFNRASLSSKMQKGTRRTCERPSGSAEATYRLVQGTGLQGAFALLAPVYRHVALDGQSRCQEIRGYTTVIIEISQLLKEALTSQEPTGSRFAMSAYSASFADTQSLAFEAGSKQFAEHDPLPVYEWIFDQRGRTTSRTFDVEGRPWHLVFSASRAPFLRTHLGSLLMLIVGTLGTLLATGYLQSLASRKHSRRQIDEIREELKRTSESLQLREQAIEACVNAIIVTGATGPEYSIERVNSAFEKMSGYTSADVVGCSCSILWDTDRDQNDVKEILSRLREKREVNAILRTCRKDGTLFWSRIYISPAKGAAGEVNHFVIAQYDITETKRYEAQLEYQASYDMQTGLPNRHLLHDRLQQVLAYADRYGCSAWVVFLGLDRFKSVGEALVDLEDASFKAIAKRVQAAVRKSDTVARVGDNEFVLILPEDQGEKLTTAVLYRIMDAIVEPLAIEGHDFFPNCNAGIATYPTDAIHPDALIEQARLAMDRVKELGPNNFQFYTPGMNERVQERRQIERALRGALERAEFLLHYQPQVDLRSGRVVGMEALLRWQHPELGSVPPDRFIEVAEEAGFIVPVGAWVLRTACAQAVAWQRAGHGDLRIAVNLSPRQLVQQDLIKLVSDVLRETGLAAHQLDLEITENAVMTDIERASDVLNCLRDLGVHLSLDDFGTGYSSLSYLKRFPIDTLKIDQSFVREISQRTSDAAISNAIISMAHNLGIRVIAEGVETEEQCEVLSRNMCDEIQGFLFSKALAANEIDALLAEAPRLPNRLLRKA